MSKDFTEESTMPLTAEYQQRAKRIERWYRFDWWFTTVLVAFCVVMINIALFRWVALPDHNPWEFVQAVLWGALIVLYSRDYNRARTYRTRRYLELTHDIAMDHSIKQLIEREEDHQ